MRLSTVFSAIAKSTVDAVNGIISGVSVITEGKVEGHDCYADATTLKQVVQVASSHANGIKVKMNHWSGVEAIVGVLKNFRIDGPNARADFHLLKSAEEYAKIIEMSQTMPEAFGFSISFSGDKETIEKVEYARCKEIYSVDLVDSPAANPCGLFSNPNHSKPMIDQKFIAKTLGLADTATEADVMAAFAKAITPATPPTVPPTAPVVPAVQAPIDFQKALDAALKPVTDKLTAMETKAAEDAKTFAKAEKAVLVAEASREGKSIPLTPEEIEQVPTPVLKAMIGKLSKTVPVAPRSIKPLKDGERDTIRKNLSEARQRGSEQMTEFFNSQPSFQNSIN